MSRSPRWARCDDCGSKAYFDALVDADGEVYNIFETAFCPTCSESGDGEIKYSYTIVDGKAPAQP